MIWALPSAIALLLKLYLCFSSDVSKQKYFYYFLMATLSLNFLELSGFFTVSHNLLMLKLYYGAAVFSALYLAISCAQISNTFTFLSREIFLICACLLAASILFTNEIISGFQVLPNGSITRIVGDYYFIFQIYLLSLIALSITVLIKGIRKKEKLTSRRSLIALFSFAPFVSMALTIVVLMQLGYQINMAGFLSLTNCIMLFAFISLHDKHKLFEMMRFVPYSKERQFHIKIRKKLLEFALPASGESVDMKNLLKEVEELVVIHTSEYFDTQKEVARLLNISESSLSRKLPKKK